MRNAANTVCVEARVDGRLRGHDGVGGFSQPTAEAR